MPMPRPQLSHERFTEQPLDRNEQKVVRKAERRPRRNLAGLSAMMAVTSLLSLYWADSNEHKIEQANADIDIEVTYVPKTSHPVDSAIVFFNGYGAIDATPIAKYEGPAMGLVEKSERWAVDYGNAVLNPESIVRQLIKLAQERGITHFSIFGRSIGGLIGAETVLGLIEANGPLVDNVALDLTPDGIDTLKEDKRNQLGILNLLTLIPGARYSNYLREGEEIIARHDNYDTGTFPEMVDHFWQTQHNVHDGLANEQLPAMALLADQAGVVTNFNLKSILSQIGEKAPEGQEPIITYIANDDPSTDPVVDTDAASENTCEYAEEADLACYIFYVKHDIHTRPDQVADEYMDMMKEAAPIIRTAIAKERLAREALRAFSGNVSKL